MPYIHATEKCMKCLTKRDTCWVGCPEGDAIEHLFAMCERCRHFLACKLDPQTCGYWNDPEEKEG